MRALADLNENETLALAISSEEEDAALYRDLSRRFQPHYPNIAGMLDRMAQEEDGHRAALLERYRQRFGDSIATVRRADIRGMPAIPPAGRRAPDVAQARDLIGAIEAANARFYDDAASLSTDVATRSLYGELAAAEHAHFNLSAALADESAEGLGEDTARERRQFILTYIQPGLAGLMDGSVSTLAPIFAAAFATQNSWQTFLVGLSAAIGAGISMGFTEAAHDDGKISGRGSPLIRGLACGIMTAIGGLGHALPYLISNFRIATMLAIAIVFVELWAIVYIQHRFMKTAWLRATVQVVIGGLLVLAAGILIGNA